MGIGVLVLLVAIQAWVDLGGILGSSSNGGFSDFLVIHKEIPADRSAHSSFTPPEVRDLERQPFVESAGPITANLFRAGAIAGFHIRFSTDLFFESVPDRFLDHRPADWVWHPGDLVVPVILSSEYLSMYNYGFALSQGLPQLSESAAKAIPIDITVSGPGGTANLVARVVGFSDRISSILVPQQFMDWANAHFALSTSSPPSGMIIRVADPSNPALVAYLKAHHYQTNNEKLRYSRIRVILATILSGIGLFGILVILLALMICAVNLRLMISGNREEIRLLTILGYESRTLARALMRGLIPWYAVVAGAGLLLTEALQWAGWKFLSQKNLPLHPWLSLYPLLGAAGVLVVFSLVTRGAVRKNIRSVC